jgi:hypothetical protein
MIEPRYRTDRFKEGDMVTWFNGHYATLTSSCRDKLGDGPFRIIKVIDRPKYEYGFGDEQSNWESMGHTQHVVIDHDEGGNDMFSGAFFKLADAGS